MRTLALVVSVLAAAPIAAQTPVRKDPDNAVPGAAAAQLPAGWSLRLDRPAANGAMPRFVRMGDGYHVTSGPAAVYYSPAMTASGAFTAEASFTQTKASAHPEAYGLVIGGKDLGGPAQDYLYFVVRQDGRFMIRHRAGTEVHTLQDWTASPAVRAADAEGKATNVLRVSAGADSVRFDVNGTQVAALPPGVNTAGLVALRVNHNLDVHVSGFKVTPATK
jgi:hypothetical protein